MRRVFYHNREDIVSMVALGSQLVRAYQEGGEPLDTLPAEDLLSLANCYLRQGDAALAEGAYRRAAEGAAHAPLRAEIFAQWALLLKRQERWAEAADLWQQWLTSVPGSDAAPFIELAKYHEWRTGDLSEAEMWAAWGLHTGEAAPTAQRQPGQLADLRHRLARIRRKQRGGQGETGTA
jgi:tetratricopeptide (TPR) repeat protein